MANNKTNKYSLHYIVTFALLALAIILSFVPILPVWSFYGFDEKHKAIYYLKYHAYYEGFNIFTSPKDFLDFLFMFSFFLGYISIALTLVFIALKKNRVTQILLVANILLFTAVSFSYSIVSSYAVILAILNAGLLIVDLAVDSQNKLLASKAEKEKEEMKIYGEMIKTKRMEKQLTQEQLAAMVHISRSMIARFETGSLSPSEKQKEKFAKILGFAEENTAKSKKNKYEDDGYKVHYLVTLAILILMIITSILPILPISVYLGLEDKRIPIYQTQVDVYYSYFFDLLGKGEVSSFFLALGMISFYVSALLTIVFIFLAEYRKAKVTSIISCLSHVLGLLTLSYISIFSTICLSICLALFIVDYSIDRNNKMKNESALERKKELMTTIGQKIKDARINKEMTQQELADKIYVSRSLIARFETGTHMPSEKQLEDLSLVLDVDFTIDSNE